MQQNPLVSKLLAITAWVVGVLVIFIVLISLSSYLWLSSFDKEIDFVSPIDQYRRAEFAPTDLISREWMKLAMNLQKVENYGPPGASRLYAYTASVFSDTLEATGDVHIASSATALMLQELLPHHSKEIFSFFSSLHQGVPVTGAEGRQVLDSYIERSKNDGHELKWTEDMIPPGPGFWYVRKLEEFPPEIIASVKAKRGFSPSFIDDGAMGGEWKPWIVLEDPGGVPPPLKSESVADRVDEEQVRYATNHRTYREKTLASFWQGAGGFFKGQERDNIAPSGLWLNLLFVEKGDSLSEKEYARTQKILAQSLADSFKYTWKIKYQYYAPRPSMRIPRLDVSLADPPFPSYVSGHSSISYTAAAVLSALFPEKRGLWYQFAHDAQYSRIIAGIHFYSDIKAGGEYGERIGLEVVRALNLNEGGTLEQVSTPYAPSFIENLVAWIALRTDRFLFEQRSLKKSGAQEQQ